MHIMTQDNDSLVEKPHFVTCFRQLKMLFVEELLLYWCHLKDQRKSISCIEQWDQEFNNFMELEKHLFGSLLSSNL